MCLLYKGTNQSLGFVYSAVAWFLNEPIRWSGCWTIAQLSYPWRLGLLHQIILSNLSKSVGELLLNSSRSVLNIFLNQPSFYLPYSGRERSVLNIFLNQPSFYLPYSSRESPLGMERLLLNSVPSRFYWASEIKQCLAVLLACKRGLGWGEGKGGVVCVGLFLIIMYNYQSKKYKYRLIAFIWIVHENLQLQKEFYIFR